MCLQKKGGKWPFDMNMFVGQKQVMGRKQISTPTLPHSPPPRGTFSDESLQ